MSILTPTETILPDSSDLDDPSDVEELFAAISGKQDEADAGKTPDAAAAPATPAPTEPVPASPPTEPTPAPAPAPAPTPEPAAAQPATPTTAQPSVPAAPAAAAPPVTATPTPTPAPEAPAVPPAPTAEQVKAEQQRQYDALVKSYALSDEDAKAMLTEPEVALPRLAANMHKAMLQQVEALIAQQVPQIVQAVTESRIVESEAQNRFFTRWPQLREHKDAVVRVGAMFRTANPKATPEQAIEQIGAIVAMSLGIGGVPSAPSAQPQAAPVAQPVPAAAPYRPAGAGGTPMAPAPADTNLYTAFADEDRRSG